MDEEPQIVAINYWKEIKMELNNIVGNIKDIALVIHNSVELEDLIDFFDRFPVRKKLLYISLTKTYGSVKDTLKKLHFSVSTIDCVSGGVFVSASAEDVLFQKMPETLDELYNIILSADKTYFPDYVVIDSFSQFMDFASANYDRKKLQIFFAKLTEIDKKIILLYEDNLARKLVGLPTLYISTILKIEMIRNKIFWQG